jgi:cation:H+ antiporter
MWLLILLIIAGLALLKFGADWFVEGSSGLARRLQVSELAIGLTIVAFGTSAPELVVNSFSSLKGNHDIVFGNIIGSNSFNLFVILSIVGLITPIKVQSSTAWREIPFSMIALIIFFLVVNDQFLLQRESSLLSRFDGIIMLGCFSLFIYYAFRQLRFDSAEPADVKRTLSNWRIAIFIFAGLAGLVVGGKLVLDNAIKLATQLGLSEKIIGLTIVAAGTSLPELATSIVAAIKRNHDIAVGNIIGSNIFNILFILPVSTMIRPLKFNPGFNIDIAFIAGGTLLLFIAMYTGKKKEIDRWEAFVLLTCYIAYLILMFQG